MIRIRGVMTHLVVPSLVLGYGLSEWVEDGIAGQATSWSRPSVVEGLMPFVWGESLWLQHPTLEG